MSVCSLKLSNRNGTEVCGNSETENHRKKPKRCGWTSKILPQLKRTKWFFHFGYQHFPITVVSKSVSPPHSSSHNIKRLSEWPFVL